MAQPRPGLEPACHRAGLCNYGLLNRMTCYISQNEKKNHFKACCKTNQARCLSRWQLFTADGVLVVWCARRLCFLSRVVCRGEHGPFHEGDGLAVWLALHLRLVVGNLEDRRQVRRAPDLATRSQGRGDRPCYAGSRDDTLRWSCCIPSPRQPWRLSLPPSLRLRASESVVCFYLRSGFFGGKGIGFGVFCLV